MAANKKDKIKKPYQAPWVKENQDWFAEATGRTNKSEVVDMETITPRIAK